MRDTSLAYRNYAALILMLGYAANFTDRQIMAILVEPIKTEFALSDSEVGLLNGLPFAFFYVVLGVPIARLADRGNRRNIVAISIASFSAMTVFCGLSANMWQLFLARMGVAVGEAGTTPAAHSMISDLFPPSERARALGIYSMGVSLGILIGFMIGGWIVHLWGWRAALLTAGVPGLVLAAVVRLTVAEPPRRQFEAATASETQPTFLASLEWLWSQRSARHLAMAGICYAVAAASMVSWGPAFFSRSFGMGPASSGTALAFIYGILGAGGAYLAGTVSDRLGRLDQRWYLWVLAIAAILSAPFAAGAFLAPNPVVSLVCYAVPAVAVTAVSGPLFASAYLLVPADRRAVTSAIFFCSWDFSAPALVRSWSASSAISIDLRGGLSLCAGRC